MADYKYWCYLHHSERSIHDVSHPPGSVAPEGGIYRCIACGYEIGVAKGALLPPQNHHRHATRRLTVEWYLLVAARERE